MLKIIVWAIALVIRAIFLGIVIGTAVWFVAQIFGADLYYFSYLKGWILFIAFFDIAHKFIRFVNREDNKI